MFPSLMAQNMRIYQRYVDLFLTASPPISSIQIVVFATHNIIKRTDKAAWALLCALRSFTIVDLFLALEEHTQLTIAYGRQELRKFGHYIQVCISL